MDIMIAGGGTVGYGLTQTSTCQDNAVVIDKDICQAQQTG